MSHPEEPSPQIAVKVHATGKKPAAGRRPTRDQTRVRVAAILVALGLLAVDAIAAIVFVVVPRSGTLIIAVPPEDRTDLYRILAGDESK